MNVLNALKACPEVCQIYCAAANPLEILIAGTDQRRGILGVVDRYPPTGVENEGECKDRHDFLRKIGYKC